jgi:hypothetical protein
VICLSKFIELFRIQSCGENKFGHPVEERKNPEHQSDGRLEDSPEKPEIEKPETRSGHHNRKTSSYLSRSRGLGHLLGVLKSSIVLQVDRDTGRHPSLTSDGVIVLKLFEGNLVVKK